LSNQQHIVFLTPGFPENEDDSRCIPALQFFFKELKKQFAGKISIVSFQYPYQENTYQWNGIDVYALGGNNSRIKKRLVWQKVKQTFKQLNKEQPVSRIHSFWMGECAFIASELAEKYNLEHDCTLMGQDVLPGNDYFKKTKKVKRFITLSSFHNQQLITNYNINSIEIPWGIEDVEHQNQEKMIDVIGVGALTELKCYNEFIEVISTVKKDHPNIKCKIIGDGPLRSELQQKIDSLNLSENIELAGLLPYSKTQELIAQSKVLLHPSGFESFGMVIIEALANNTRVIAKPVGIANNVDEVIKVKGVDDAVKELKISLKEEEVATYPFNYLVKNTVTKYIQLFNE